MFIDVNSKHNENKLIVISIIWYIFKFSFNKTVCMQNKMTFINNTIKWKQRNKTVGGFLLFLNATGLSKFHRCICISKWKKSPFIFLHSKCTLINFQPIWTYYHMSMWFKYSIRLIVFILTFEKCQQFSFLQLTKHFIVHKSFSFKRKIIYSFNLYVERGWKYWSDLQGSGDYKTGLVQTSSEETMPWFSSPLIVSRDAFSPWNWGHPQNGWCKAYFLRMSLYILLNGIWLGDTSILD